MRLFASALAVAVALPAQASARAPLRPRQSDLSPKCSYFVAAARGDTCQSLASQNGITVDNLVCLNPSVGTTATCNLTPGKFYCLEWDSGRSSPTCGAVPSTTAQSSTVTSTLTTGATTAPPTSRTTAPATTSRTTARSTSTVPAPTTTGRSPTQAGIAPNCNNYYLVKPADSCQGILNQYPGLTLDQFYSYNPAVGNTCTSLISGYYVCVGVSGGSPTLAAPTQNGIRSGCTKYYVAQQGDYCQRIVDAQNGAITLQQFLTWNPPVGSSCNALLIGYAYCIAIPGTPTIIAPTGGPAPPANVPTPLQPGTLTTCRTYYQLRPGDYCYSIIQQYSLNENDFYTWNAGVKRDCSNLQAGSWICVGM